MSSWHDNFLFTDTISLHTLTIVYLIFPLKLIYPKNDVSKMKRSFNVWSYPLISFGKLCWQDKLVRIWKRSVFCSLRSMYIFGGFSGVIQNDVLVFKPASCEAFIRMDVCQSAGPGVRCVWIENRCEPWDSSHANDSVPASFCPARSSKILSY